MSEQSSMTTPLASYQAALEELDRLLLQLEDPQTPLDQLLPMSQRASALLAYCQNYLREIEAALPPL